MITDQGLNYIGGTINYMRNCQAGTGNGAPAAGDTGLDTYVAGTATVQSDTTSTQAVPTYYGARTRIWRFAPGLPGAPNNFAEIGVSTTTTTGNLFSRALVLDGAGAPTTVTVDDDEYFDVTYQLRLYPPNDDVDDTILISGVNHTIKTRARDVTDVNVWADGIGFISNGAYAGSGSGGSVAFDGAIGAITAGPTGSNDTATSKVNFSYGNLDLYRDTTYTWGLDDGNIGGISAVQFVNTMGSYQMSFSPDIDKDNTKTLALVFRVSWARKVIGLITAATISAQASDNSFNDSASGFLDAAFNIGDSIDVTGFTGDVANNITGGTIATLTAAKMTISAPDGDDIVNDAAGESVTITI
jgi:hypothetical protein